MGVCVWMCVGAGSVSGGGCGRSQVIVKVSTLREVYYLLPSEISLVLPV